MAGRSRTADDRWRPKGRSSTPVIPQPHPSPRRALPPAARERYLVPPSAVRLGLPLPTNPLLHPYSVRVRVLSTSALSALYMTIPPLRSDSTMSDLHQLSHAADIHRHSGQAYDTHSSSPSDQPRPTAIVLPPMRSSPPPRSPAEESNCRALNSASYSSLSAHSLSSRLVHPQLRALLPVHRPRVRPPHWTIGQHPAWALAHGVRAHRGEAFSL
jgi:hypothetical protein